MATSKLLVMASDLRAMASDPMINVTMDVNTCRHFKSGLDQCMSSRAACGTCIKAVHRASMGLLSLQGLPMVLLCFLVAAHAAQAIGELFNGSISRRVPLLCIHWLSMLSSRGIELALHSGSDALFGRY